MTCIAGVAKGSKVWIGADSAASEPSGDGLDVRADEKVVRKGEFLIGAAGSLRAGDLLRHAFDPPKQLKKQTDAEFLVMTFVDALRRLFVNAGLRIDSDDWDSTFLVGYRGHLYYVDTDFSVGRNAAGFAACGSGGWLAVGALDATPARPPSIRVRLALEAAERWCSSVRGPFIVKSV